MTYWSGSDSVCDSYGKYKASLKKDLRLNVDWIAATSVQLSGARET